MSEQSPGPLTIEQFKEIVEPLLVMAKRHGKDLGFIDGVMAASRVAVEPGVYGMPGEVVAMAILALVPLPNVAVDPPAGSS